MAIYKRGEIYWYKFMWDRKLIRRSTRQGNHKVARQIEAAHRTSLAKGEVGIRERKPPLSLRDFIDKRFEPRVKARFERSSPKTWFGWYRPNLKVISEYKPLADKSLSEITSEHVSDFAAFRQTKQRKGKVLAVSSVNSSLRVLRRVVRVAVEWGVITSAPKIMLLRGETRRERVISQAEIAKYLSAAPEPLATVATVLCDTGMRPEECYRLRWEAMAWTNGRHGTLLVTHGKTAAARRVLPMSLRVRTVLESRWECAGKPQEGWVFVAPTMSGHIEPSSLRKQHARTFAIVSAEAKKNGQPEVKSWVLYAFRHAFLTRLGESGCDTWTLARVAGHNSIAMSSRYVHPSADRILDVVCNLGRRNSGHTLETALPERKEPETINDSQ